MWPFNKIAKTEVPEPDSLDIKSDGVTEMHVDAIWGDFPLVKALCDQLVGIMRTQGAINYLEMILSDNLNHEFSVVIRPKNGLTPAEKACRLTKLVERLFEVTLTPEELERCKAEFEQINGEQISSS